MSDDAPLPEAMLPDAMLPGASLLGATLELEIGPPAHGGSCVARHPDGPGGRVVFVRHTLPGERVRALVTEDRGRFCLADAVEILEPSPSRVTPPCPHAGPGRCGGCDWQHADAGTQLELKTAVVREQFTRLAHLSLESFTGVEALPGGLLGWRTRTQYAVGADGRPGLRRHHSHELERVERCPLGVPGVGDSPVLAETWPGLSGVEVAIGSDGAAAVLAHRPGGRAGGGRPARGRGRRPPDRVTPVRGPERLTYAAGGRHFDVHAGGFWQVHPEAVPVLTATLLDFVAPQPGETVFDLYCGAGALTAPLALAVGASGRVVALESDRTAAADAGANLADLPQAEVRCERVTDATLAALATVPANAPDVVVLDPPRTGAGREVMQTLLDLRPRCIGYVACDPAALARDVATALAAGWELRALRAFDAFPMTHHVECVALLEPAPADRPGP